MNNFSVKYVELMPTNLAERLLLPENIACQAEISDYLAMTEICQYRIEYHQGYIISWGTYLYDFMKNHELIIPVLIYLLLDYIEKNELSWKITSSNLEIYIYDSKRSHCYKPDVAIFKQEIEEITFTNPTDHKNRTAASNPNTVFEILSDSTRNFDLTSKLANYKKIPSIEQIIFIEQDRCGVYIHEKTEGNWRETSYESKNDFFMIDECPIFLKKLYKNITF